MRNTTSSLLITTFGRLSHKDTNQALSQTICKSQLAHNRLFQNHCPLPHPRAKLIATKPPPPPKYTDHFHEKRFQSPRRLNLFTAVSVFTHRKDFLHAPRRPKKVFTKTQKRLPRERYFVLTRTKQGFHKNQTAFLQEGCMVFASKQQQIYQKEPHLPFFDNRPFSKTPFSEGEKSIKITHLARKIPSKSKNRHLRYPIFSPQKRPLLYNLAI
ncbi:MAG: hypothetical protein ACRDCS_06290 [Tannerellaceae bacterium]